MSIATIFFPKLYFSYSQFMVYDRSVDLPGCDWTEKHSAQGFARREATVNFNTLLEYGHAEVSITIGVYRSNNRYERVIGVPFLVTSGTIIVEGPEEIEVERTLSLPASNYWLVVAQYAINVNEENIDLFFEQMDEPVKSSRIILADALLNPQLPLIETAGVAGE